VAFEAIVGTGGTFIGIARALKGRDPAIRCLAVEPAGSQILAGLAVTNAAHKLQGAGYAMIPPLWDAGLCDGTLPIGDDEAIAVARELARREGILAGFSTGANVAAALRLASTAPGLRLATVACDTGTRYLSSNLFASE
jgi:cysteine synthase A